MMTKLLYIFWQIQRVALMFLLIWSQQLQKWKRFDVELPSSPLHLEGKSQNRAPPEDLASESIMVGTELSEWGPS